MALAPAPALARVTAPVRVMALVPAPALARVTALVRVMALLDVRKIDRFADPASHGPRAIASMGMARSMSRRSIEG